MITYSLPYPPTVNGLFVQAGDRRIKSKPYKAWREAAGWAIAEQGRKRMAGNVMLILECVRPDGRKRDISNLIKAVEDLLVEMGVIEDDQYVDLVSAAWVRRGPPCRVIVTASPFELDLDGPPAQ